MHNLLPKVMIQEMCSCLEIRIRDIPFEFLRGAEGKTKIKNMWGGVCDKNEIYGEGCPQCMGMGQRNFFPLPLLGSHIELALHVYKLS